MAELDDKGFRPDTLGERNDELDAAFLAVFPARGTESLDLTPSSYTGRANTILAEQLVSSDNLVASFLEVLDPQQATGVFVDFHLRLQATRRKSATFSTIPVLLQGIPGTLVGDKLSRYTPNDSLWRTPALNAEGLALVIEANGFLTTDVTATVSGPIDAVETGTTSWIIVDQTVGWDTIESTARAGAGTTVESDPAARVRLARPSTSALGTAATKPAIVKRLFAIDGVIDADINNNRKLVPDNGVPGKTIEAIVEGGDPQVVADTILASYPGTSGFFGNTPRTATASITQPDGSIVTITEEVRYTIPERVQIIASYTIVYGRPDLAPDDNGVALALAAAGDYINNAGRGVDVVPTASGSAIVAALPPASEPVVTPLAAIKGAGAPAAATIPISLRQRAFTVSTAQAAIVTGTVAEPYSFVVSWVLVLSVDAAAPVTVTFSPTDFVTISVARALEVATVIASQVDTLNAGVNEGVVELVSKTSGAASSIEILVSTSPDLLAVLGFVVATTVGSDGDIDIVVSP